MHEVDHAEVVAADAVAAAGAEKDQDVAEEHTVPMVGEVLAAVEH